MECDDLSDAYSDDMCYLSELDRMIESQPGGTVTPDFIKYSCCCRLWATMMVGTFEMAVKKWGNGDPFWHDINRYLKDGKRDGRPNKERVKRLEDAIRNRGFKVSVADYDDLLAIIYIRNAYVHGRWRPEQARYVASRGFPRDLMRFDQGHFVRMKAIYDAVLNPLGITMALSPARRG